MTPSTDKDTPHWYIVYVRSCCERKAAQSLTEIGVENYLPLRREIHHWSDRNKVVARLLLPHMIFIRVTELGRRMALQNRYLSHCMMDSTTGHVAVVPDSQMDTFRSMVELGHAPVTISSEPLAPGDKVRVVTGPLAGLECELTSVSGGRCIAVRLGPLGTALMHLPTDTLEKM